MKTYILLLSGAALGSCITVLVMHLLPHNTEFKPTEELQEVVRAAVVLNESRLEKRYFDLEERNTRLEDRVYNLECAKIKGCVKK